MDGQSDDSKQSTADMTAFVQNLLQQMHFLFLFPLVAPYFLDFYSLDDMGNRINELEQSINDLKAEMGVEGSPSPLNPSKPMAGEGAEVEGSA